jgi:hypothetical protein
LIAAILALFLWVLVLWAIVLWVAAVFDREARLSRKGKVALVVAMLTDAGILVAIAAWARHTALWWLLPWGWGSF